MSGTKNEFIILNQVFKFVYKFFLWLRGFKFLIGQVQTSQKWVPYLILVCVIQNNVYQRNVSFILPGVPSQVSVVSIESCEHIDFAILKNDRTQKTCRVYGVFECRGMAFSQFNTDWNYW